MNDDAPAFGNPGSGQLAAALGRGDDAAARELIAAGASPDAIDADGVPLLQWTMLRDDRAAFRRLLALNADPTVPNADGQTAIHLAAMGKQTYWLDALLETGANVDQPNTRTGATPLFDALRAGLPANVARLREAGARLDVRSRDGTTPLHQAALVNDLAATRAFLEAGADPRATDDASATFQDYLFDGDPKILNATSKRELSAIRALLSRAGVGITAASLR